MPLWRRLGFGGSALPDPGGDTESVRRISARLERLDSGTARHLAAFAYVLARVAQADLRIEAAEAEEMTRVVTEVAGLSADEAALVVEIAKSQVRLLGGTENYVVTREFRRISTPEQRARLLECLYAVAAADGSISSVETSEIDAIGEELGFTRPEVLALRSAWRDRLSVLAPGTG
jgi:uncharacterized tellurite resistance protein B-like protein